MRANFDSMKFAVEGLSGGKNTVIFDDRDMPSIMVRIPQLKNNQLISEGTDEVHDAFKIDTVVYDCLYIGKYLATVINDRAYSLAGKDPRTSVDYDKAREYCRNKGKGWHLPTNALYAANALWCKKNGTQPHGNTSYGRDHVATYETAFPSMARDGSNRVQRTATGSGPDSWYHDFNSATGIADLCGNVWEWASGLRLKDGEIQVIPYGNAMADTLTGAQDIAKDGSTAWKAIGKNGDFVDLGSPDTLKWDYTQDPAANSANIEVTSGTLAHKQTDEAHYGSQNFWSLAKHSDLTIPKRMILLGLYPEDAEAEKYDSRGRFWMRNSGERLPIRGGDWSSGAVAGVFSLYLSNLRSSAGANVGFRPAYYGNL